MVEKEHRYRFVVMVLGRVKDGMVIRNNGVDQEFFEVAYIIRI